MNTLVAPPAPFALGFAQPRQAKPSTPLTYDPRQQVSVTADGRPAAEDHILLMGTSVTTSTAGSKTHNDDD
ncbi:putative ATP-grasp-modified RiPP [Streptomyces griseoaurantiacus]|uniref:putative ATP-grasp-modified RiPP n=1 Tax=Streptomyces griseoaurantiacus TaxID=68213 RepID=UPI00369B2305